MALWIAILCFGQGASSGDHDSFWGSAGVSKDGIMTFKIRLIITTTTSSFTHYYIKVI